LWMLWMPKPAPSPSGIRRANNVQDEKSGSRIHRKHLYAGWQVPFLKSIPFGLQHVLAMFVANIAPIMIVTGASGLSVQETASLIQAAMIMAGIGTLVQLFTAWKLGAKLPIVMGISFTFVSVFCYVGPQWGYEAVIGAVLVGGVIEGLLGFFAKYWRKIISPIVAALSLSIGLGFTQVPEMFNIFPDIIRTIFAENCVAVVFLAAIIMNLIMPKDSDA